MEPIKCQACEGKPQKEGCSTCGGSGCVFGVFKCLGCGRWSLVRSGSHTTYEGKRWRSVDGLGFTDHAKSHALCHHCEPWED